MPGLGARPRNQALVAAAQHSIPVNMACPGRLAADARTRQAASPVQRCGFKELVGRVGLSGVSLTPVD